MGVTRTVLKDGNGTDVPKAGDTVIIEYTGNLYDESQKDNHYRGKQSVLMMLMFNALYRRLIWSLSGSTPP